MKSIILYTIISIFILSGCKDKATKTAPVKKTTVATQIEPEIDTAVVNQVIAEEPIVEAEPIIPNTYFLISGSFQNYSNAEKYQQNLTDQGMDSQIIQRQQGPNSQFYKVSYMGFNDWNEALRTLKYERNTPGKEGVWLLVKK